MTKRLYDANNNLDEEDFPDGTKSTWVYNQTWNQPTQYVDAAGQETDYGLDATNGNVLTVTQISHTQGVTNRTTEYTYTPDPTTQGQTPGGLAAARTTASSAWHRRPRRSLCC